MPEQRTDRGVLVTGGGSGIGAEICRVLAARGHPVVIFDRRAEPAADVAGEVDGAAVVVDVADADQVAEAFASWGKYGAGRLVGLVNCAGVGNLKRLEDYTPAEVELIWRVNFGGTFNCLRSAAPQLRSGGGAVVNIASVSGVRPTRGEAPYSAAKAAVIALTKSAALEWAPEVRVNCVSPGFIRTPLNDVLAGDSGMRAGIEDRTPAGRLGTAEETAELVAFLLSEHAGYLTGQNIVLDGGSMLSSEQMDPVLGPMVEG